MRKRAVGLLAVMVLLCACAKAPVSTQPSELPDQQTEEDTMAYTQPVTLPMESVTPATEPVTEPTTEPAAEPEEDAFVRVMDYLPHLRVELAYATDNNFTGTVIYDFTDAYLRYGTVQKMMKADLMLAEQGYGLVIWDAYRPVYAQERLWEICPDPAYVSKPGTGTQSHCRGIAVDVTLYDLETGEELEMPTGFDNFSLLADRDYSDCSDETASNAALLEKVMKECGFKPYSAEWWHFSDTQSYDIEYIFDPAQMN